MDRPKFEVADVFRRYGEAYEALLATFSILLWHFYLVIFDPLVYPMGTAWLDGKISADHYRHSRPEYLRMLQQADAVKSVLHEAPAEKRSEKLPGADSQKDRP